VSIALFATDGDTGLAGATCTNGVGIPLAIFVCGIGFGTGSESFGSGGEGCSGGGTLAEELETEESGWLEEAVEPAD